MNRITIRMIAAAGAACLLSANEATAANIIVAENFGGLSSANLHDTLADTFASGISTAGGSATWVAKTTDFRADGSVVGTGTGSNFGGSAYLDLGTYINDARNTANGKFVLTATISSVTGGSWLALGFASETAPNTLRNFSNANTGGTTSTSGYANMAYRTNGDIDQWKGVRNTNEVAANDVTFSGNRTLTITLDFTPLGGYDGVTNFGTASFGANVGVGDIYQEFGASVFTANPTIGSILLSWAGATSVGSVTDGGFSNLTLTQVPEPAAALLGSLGLFALLRRRR